MDIPIVHPLPVTVPTDLAHGMPVFVGTDVPIQTLIDHLLIGDSIDGFLDENPAVSREQVAAFLEHARDCAMGAAAAKPDASDAFPATALASGTQSAGGPVANLYVDWQSHLLPDPRTAPLGELVKGLVEIVGAEGPMLCYRAYTLYARSIGLQKIREETKLRFNRAMIRAVETQVLVVNDEAARDDLTAKIVRLPDAPEIRLRSRGDRKIEEVPPLEIAAYMRTFTTDVDTLDDDGAEWLFRSVLDGYELIRMTDHTKSVLQTALELAQDNARWT